jgi:hypothetical protein
MKNEYKKPFVVRAATVLDKEQAQLITSIRKILGIDAQCSFCLKWERCHFIPQQVMP